MLEIEYKGQKYTLIHCDGALDSLNEILNKHYPQPKSKKTMINKLIVQINRLVDGHQMSKENFPQEGELPDNAGHFNAIKKIPIRGYIWKSKLITDTYFVSHYVYKNYQKLKDSDTEIVGRNWEVVEKVK